MTDYIVPLLLLLVCSIAIRKKEDPYTLLISGAAQGLTLLVQLLPTLVLLMTAVTMLRNSGATDAISQWMSPALQFFGIPAETAMLILIRPISGSAALAVGSELMAEHGVNSLVGRTVAIMLGSTETTFYTISVYFGAAGVKRTRYTIIAALFADFVGFFMAACTARFL